MKKLRGLFRTPADYIAALVVIVVLVAAIFGAYSFLRWMGSGFGEHSVPAKFQSGVWVRVKDVWVKPGQEITVRGEVAVDSASVEVMINDLSKYWYEVELANGSYDDVKNRVDSTIVTGADGSTRYIIVHDRATNKKLPAIKVEVQTY